MIRRLLILLLLSAPAFANQAAQGWCQLGGQHVSLSGLTSSNFVQQSYPVCTVTVRLVSNGALATIYSDNASTPLANPFSATSTGFWEFYASNNRYNVSLTGGGISGTILVPDVLLNDPAGGGGTVNSVFGRTGTVIAQSGDYDCTLVTNSACLTSPVFLGVPLAPTAAPGTNTTQLATTAFVQAALPAVPVTSVFTRTGAVVATSGDYTVAQVTGAAPLASPIFTGVPAAPTATLGTNTTQLATTAFVQTALSGATSPVTSVFSRTGVVVATSGDYGVAQITGAAPLANPVFTGDPQAPTPSTGDNDTSVATSAFVKAQGYLTIANAALGISCGTTTTCASTTTNFVRIAYGTVTLSAGTATVTAISPVFTSTSSFNCTASDLTTGTLGANATPASSSSITVTGTTTDVISYICTGS